MDGYLFNLKIKVSKTRLKMLCPVVLISIIHCISEITSTHCDFSGDLSNEVSWFLSSLSLSQFCEPDLKKAIYHQVIIKKICINKSFPQKNNNSAYGISKTKDKFLTYCVTIIFISNKTRYSPLNGGTVEEKGLEILAFFKQL